MRAASWIGLLGAIAVTGCAPVPPWATVLAPIDGETPPRLFVTSAEERAALVAALVRAGLQVSDDARGVEFVLNARLGSRRSRRECGALRNVVFDLHRSGVRVAVIKGRGWTGRCDPNILDEMARELARLLGSPASP